MAATTAGNGCPDPRWVIPPVRGWRHRFRRVVQWSILAILVVAPWADLLRFDLPAGRLVLMGTGFRVNELGPVYVLLVLGMLAIFAGALLYGRLWCGWLCPQTTLSELAASADRKLGRAGWVASAGFAVGATLVLTAYFTGPAQSWLFPVLFAVLAADLFWLRHDFCLRACPYGVLQALARDDATLGVDFDQTVLEKCVRCNACIRSCFIGIDIRKQPFDPRCLNCGDCVDAIEESHRRRGLPRAVTFSYGRAPSSWPRPLAAIGIRDARRAAVAAVLVAVAALFVGLVQGRQPVEMRLSPRYDRSVPGAVGVSNAYDLTINNRTESVLRLRVAAGGAMALEVVAPEGELEVPAGGDTKSALILRLASPGLAPGAYPAWVRLTGLPGDSVLEAPARFFVPGRSPR